MSEKSPGQPTLENGNKEVWLRELVSKKTRDIILARIRQMGLSPADTDDAAQQVLLKATSAIKADKFKGDSQLTTWLYRIATNEALNLLKQKKRDLKVDSIDVAPEVVSEKPTSVESYMAAEQSMVAKQKLKLLLNKLSLTQREVIKLNLKGLSYRQIAEQLNMNPTTVGTTLHHARKRLKELIEAEDKK